MSLCSSSSLCWLNMKVRVWCQDYSERPQRERDKSLLRFGQKVKHRRFSSAYECVEQWWLNLNYCTILICAQIKIKTSHCHHTVFWLSDTDGLHYRVWVSTMWSVTSRGESRGLNGAGEEVISHSVLALSLIMDIAHKDRCQALTFITATFTIRAGNGDIIH